MFGAQPVVFGPPRQMFGANGANVRSPRGLAVFPTSLRSYTKYIYFV
jgi:hypothetical protein